MVHASQRGFGRDSSGGVDCRLIQGDTWSSRAWLKKVPVIQSSPAILASYYSDVNPSPKSFFVHVGFAWREKILRGRSQGGCHLVGHIQLRDVPALQELRYVALGPAHGACELELGHIQFAQPAGDVAEKHRVR